jgi:hypothetical protein
MATGKQIFQVRIGAYVYKLGGYVAFTGQPNNIDCWNIDIVYEPDFLGDVSQQALTGYERGGTMGWRAVANVDLNNSRPAEATKILTLLNSMQSQYNRLFYPASGSVAAGTISRINKTVTITGTNVSSSNNFYTGLDLYNVTRDERRRITNYVGSTNVATVSGEIDSWLGSGDSGGPDQIQVYVPPAYPTIIGLSPDTNANNIEYFNIQGGSSFGINRELTIGTQSINIQLRGVERKQTIPDAVRIDI